MKLLPPLAAALVLAIAPACLADDFQGAPAILRQIQPGAATAVSNPADPGSQWWADLQAYKKSSPSLDPGTAATQWLALFDRFFLLKPADWHTAFSHIGTDQRQHILLRSLPGPAAWPALASQVETRTAAASRQVTPASAIRDGAIDSALRLLTHTLVANASAQRDDLGAIASSGPSAKFYFSTLNVPKLQADLADLSGDSSSVVDAFRARLKAASLPPAQHDTENYNTFFVPDLVTLMGGAKQAEPLIRQAVLVRNSTIQVEGDATRKLAIRAALDQVADLKVARWDLASSLDAADLFEALWKRFPNKNYESSNARGYYLLHLIIDHQTARAVAFASDQSTGGDSLNLPIDDLESAGYTAEVHDFVRDLLTAHPEVPLWDEYISLSAKTGQTAPMLTLMASIANRSDLSAAQRQSILSHYYLALLAADKVDDAATELRKLIATPAPAPKNPTLIDAMTGDDSQAIDPFEKSVALARIGQLTERMDLLEEGIADAWKQSTSRPNPEDSTAALSFSELLVQAGRAPEAEKFLAQCISKSGDIDYSSGKSEYLAGLVRVYFESNRPDDVLSVLQDFPGWNISDLGEQISFNTRGYDLAEFSTHAAPQDYYIAYMAAWALAQKGRNDEALKLVNALLDDDISFDPAYELLTKISGQDAIPRLDLLATRDRFETRPLIWKAQLQLDAGKLNDAEKTARAAIAIDPSDGEQGPGRRMRAYAVLADILDRKGDKEHAQIYHGAVDAIRISEHSDRFYEAGLLTRAVKMYEDALSHFADAYCIQSRLALRLSELGDNAGAEEHYRRAYELMPESFGRVESHCFGCERAFDGPGPQGIAEKVFTQLATTEPFKPQVHYLLGYLRREQGRYLDALPEYEKAVKLDPDYLNAWKNIAEMRNSVRVPTDLCNQVAINEIRLDPLQHHISYSLDGVTDLKGVWESAAAVTVKAPPPPGALFPLTATAASSQANHFSTSGMMDGSPSRNSILEPAMLIDNNEFVAAAFDILAHVAQSPDSNQ